MYYYDFNSDGTATQSERAEIRKGCGHYESKAYKPTIKTICEHDGFVLRTVNDKPEILWDGEVVNRYDTIKTAETFFIDFADLTKAKYNKLKKAV